METHILSKKQLRTTLSAKKNRPKETIKNILALPYNNTYWPELSLEYQAELLEVLVANIPKIKNEKVNVPWSLLKNIPKTERKNYRLEYAKNLNGNQSEPDKDICGCISLGINMVSKMLEKNSAQAILLSAEVQPRLLVQHILDQAVLYKVPILCVNKLAETLKSRTGISSVCFAFNKEVTADSKCNLIIDKIKEIFTNLPPPENHINYNRSIVSHEINKESKEKNGMKQKEKLKVDKVEIHKHFHLKRVDKSCRAFIPEIEETKQNVLIMEVDESGFLPLSVESKLEFKKEKIIDNINAKHHYKSLIVKRLKGDKERGKKKIENLKRKRK